MLRQIEAQLKHLHTPASRFAFVLSASLLDVAEVFWSACRYGSPCFSTNAWPLFSYPFKGGASSHTQSYKACIMHDTDT